MLKRILTLMMAFFAIAWSAQANEITGLTLTIRHNGGEAFTQSFPAEGWPELDLTDELTTSIIIQKIEVQTSGFVPQVEFRATMYKTANGLTPEDGWRTFPLSQNGENSWLLDFGDGVDLIDSEMSPNKPRTFQFYIWGQDGSGNELYFNNGGLDYKVLFVKGEGGGSSTEGIKSFKLTINCDGEVFTQSFPSEGWPGHTIEGQTSSIKILRVEVETGESMTSVGFCWTLYDAADGWQHDDSAWGWMNLEDKGGGHWEYDWGEGMEFVESEWLTDTKTKTIEFFVKAWDKNGNEYKHTNGINEQGYDNNYKVTFSTGEGGGGSDWTVKFYKESTASLSLLVNGEVQSYVFDGDGTRLPDMQPGDAYSLIIDGFHVMFIYNDNVKVNDVSIQYKVYEEGQEGGWNRIDAMSYNDEDVYNPEKDRVEHRMTCYAYGLGREVSAGLEYGKNYVLEVIYQVVTTDGDYSFLGRDKEGSRFRFYYDNETGISQMVNGQSLNGKWYNLAGQRVGMDYKGIVISKGKKVLRQ
jgi:hypothetical protein